MRLQALGVMALFVLSCSSDAHIRLLEPDRSPDTGGSPRDAGTDAGDVGGLDALMLRYDFSGSGTRVADRVGSASALLLGGAMLDGKGSVTLDGDDDYVDLPNHLISKLTSATFVSWLEWNGGVCWQRVFDFGANDGGEGNVGRVTSSLFVSAKACGPETLIAEAEFGSKQIGITGPAPLPSRRLVQVALVVDGPRDTFAVYVDGMRQAKASAGFKLSAIDDVNNWLGRSQWVQDLNLSARYDEFRIYAAALSDADIATLYARGPDRL